MTKFSPINSALHEIQFSLQNLAALGYGKAALVIAHPGHELRVYGWLETIKPIVCVLTNGAGHTEKSRLHSTTRILESVGATPGSIYGKYADTEIYRAVLRQDFKFFTDLVDSFVRFLIDQKIDYVVGDASEGYNPGHDVCRLVINTAVEIVQQKMGASIANFEFLLIGHPDQSPQEFEAKTFRFVLDNATHRRKLEVSRGYAEMISEVESALAEFGEESFRTESFRPLMSVATSEDQVEKVPFYEQHGERQVAAGYYQHVIRYRQHILPLVEALQRYVNRRALWVDCGS